MLNPGSTSRGFDEPVLPVFSPYINAGTEFLSSLPAPIEFPAKALVLEQGERPTFVRLIRTGIVKLTCTDAQGDETVLGLRSEGWWAGAPLALLEMPSLCRVTAVTSCQICSIPVDEFLASLMQNQRALRHFISAQSRELVVAQQQAAMQAASAEARLDRLQQEHANSPWKTVNPLSFFKQNEIAGLLKMTPEHLSRLQTGSRRRTTQRARAQAMPQPHRMQTSMTSTMA